MSVYSARECLHCRREGGRETQHQHTPLPGQASAKDAPIEEEEEAAHPCTCPRTGLEATWGSGRGPCPRQGGGVRLSSRPLPAQPPV